MKKAALLMGVIAVLGAACFAPAKAKRYFDFVIPGGTGGPAFDRALLVERIDVDDVYNDFRIIYRVSPTELNYYAYEFWATKPDRLLQAAVDHYLTVRKAFRRVALELGKEDPDWVFRGRVHRLEEIDELTAWSARLAMDVEIRDYKSGALLARRTFDRSVSLARKDVTLLPDALSRILGEEIEAMLGDISAGR
jgi:ABC-type uncharacterized transport system auxiliary subunit